VDDAPQRQATYLLALMGLPRIGRWSAIQIARAFPDGDWRTASEATRSDRLEGRVARSLTNVSAHEWLRLVARAVLVVAAHQERGVTVVAVDEPDYPPLLRLASGPPPVLFVRGSTAALRSVDAVAVVGTREPTAGGEIVARRLAAALVQAGFVVISGLAKGIDTAAHVGALDASGKTIAILGTAIDKIYPAANKELAARIESTGGALVSEYAIGAPTSGRQFVERDRVQAAFSIAVVPVQTGIEGGTLHAVRFAHELHRAVLAPRPLAAEESHPMYDGIKVLLDSGRVAMIEGQGEYAWLANYLRRHRDWLVAGSAGSPPAPAGGSKPLPHNDAQQLGLFGEPGSERGQHS